MLPLRYILGVRASGEEAAARPQVGWLGAACAVSARAVAAPPAFRGCACLGCPSSLCGVCPPARGELWLPAVEIASAIREGLYLATRGGQVARCYLRPCSLCSMRPPLLVSPAGDSESAVWCKLGGIGPSPCALVAPHGKLGGMDPSPCHPYIMMSSSSSCRLRAICGTVRGKLGGIDPSPCSFAVPGGK